MRWGLLCLFSLIMVSLSACNLGAADPEPLLPTATPTPASAITKPQVIITSPANGDNFPINQPILVSARATDTIGVTRVQLFANGSIVKTIASANIAGDAVLNAVLDYTPRVQGAVTLRVIAYRGSVTSDPVEINVNVGTTNPPTPIPTSSDGSTIPQIPNDGVCRILTTNNLNFRTTPTTSQQNVITILPSNTLAQVVGRLGDNSWWKITHQGRIGWVSAQFTTPSGNCLNIPAENPFVGAATWTPVPTWTPFVGIPTITPTFTLAPTITPTSAPTNTPVPTLPDLLITSVEGPTSITLLANSVIFETYNVVITNNSIGASGAFSVIMRVNETETVDLGVISGLGAGQSISLAANVRYSVSGTYTLRFIADSQNAVPELSEVNNQALISVVVQSAQP